MADFRIDELELNWSSADTYNLVATANPTMHEDNEVYGTLTGTELHFEPPATIKATERVFFKYDDLNFRSYNEYESTTLFIYDAAKPRKKGGVVITNTIYPPPNSYTSSFSPIPVTNYSFSDRFTVKKLVIKRIGTTNTFSVNMFCDYDPAFGEYKMDSYEFRADPNTNDQPVLIFNFTEKPSSPPIIPVTSFATDIDFGADPNVLPFFIVKKGDNWDDVNVKKGMFFII